MLVHAIFFLAIVWCCVRWHRLSKFYPCFNQIRSDAICLPIIGHAYKFFLRNSEEYMIQIQQFGREALKKGGILSIWAGSFPVVFLADPELVDSVNKACLEKGELGTLMRFVTGNGSIFAPVEIWRPRRKITVQIFSQKNLVHFVSIFAQQSVILAKRLEAALDRGPFPVWAYATTYAMDAVCETTLGVKLKSQENSEHPFLKAFDVASKILATRVFWIPLHNDLVFRITPYYAQMKKATTNLYNYFTQIVSAKRKEMADKKRKNHTDDTHHIKAFLELLLESSDFSDVELREEMLVIMMAGMDTSAVGVCFALLMLARHQDLQKEVYQEVIEELGSEPVTFNALSRLKKLDRFIRESLRLYPPVPCGDRITDRDIILPNGVKLVKGTQIVALIWAIHRHPKYWGPDAEIFRPERFLEPLTHPAQFMPFSYGPRNCIGSQYAMLSMKTVMATLLRQYQVLPAFSNGEKEEPIRLEFVIMMKDVNKFRIRLTRRHKS